MSTCCCKKITLLFALLAIGLLATPAFATNNCMQDEFDAFNGTPGVTLNCTANDVSVADVTGVTIISGGVGDSCLQGAPFTFVADFKVVTTSSKTRSNVGLYFGTGQSSALVGTCTDAILSPQYTCPGTGGAGQPPAVTCGDAQYTELDNAINGETTSGSPIGCGDTSSGINNAQQFAELEVGPVTCPTTTVPCPSDPTKQCMPMPECTSWWQPTSTMPVCESPAPTYGWQPQAIPGTKSKCSCTTLFIPVQPVKPAVKVAKSCNIPPDATTGLTSCDAGPEGNTVKYTVTITNTTPTGEGDVVVDQICDDQYGTVTDDGKFPACTAGKVGSIVPGSATSCAGLTVPNGGSASCTFEAVQGENATVVDTVTVSGHSSLVSTSTFGPTGSNTVTVTSEDAPSTVTTTKGLEPGPQSACVTLRYDVTIANTSAADESISFTGLNDSAYGNIAALSGNAGLDASVVGTTCGVDTGSPGLGTLKGSSGAGLFGSALAAGTGTPPTKDGGTYKCQFDGVICGTPTSGVVANCLAGLSKPDTVNTTGLTGDDPAPNADKVTEKDNKFTANVCLVQSGS